MRVGSHDGRRTIHLRRLREIPAASYLSQHVERRMSVGRCSQLVHIPSGQLAKKNRPPGCCPCSNTFLINSNDALGLDGNVTVYWTWQPSCMRHVNFFSRSSEQDSLGLSPRPVGIRTDLDPADVHVGRDARTAKKSKGSGVRNFSQPPPGMLTTNHLYLAVARSSSCRYGT